MKFRLFMSAALAALAGLALANNVSVVWQWWQGFLAAGGKSAEFAPQIRGFLPWLDWCAVDHSAVTTFIPFLGLLQVVRGMWRIMRQKPVATEDFPFSAYTDKLNVALGLFGTLWGIILIGFYDLDAVTMADLMQCLHTALFSTLMAVVWVFMIDHPLIRPAMRRLLEKHGKVAAERSDLAAAVGEFTRQMHSASEAVRRIGEESAKMMAEERARHRSELDSMRELWNAERERHRRENEDAAERFRRENEEASERFRRTLGELEAQMRSGEERHSRLLQETEDRCRKLLEKLEAEHVREKTDLERRREAVERKMDAVRKALAAD